MTQSDREPDGEIRIADDGESGFTLDGTLVSDNGRPQPVQVAQADTGVPAEGGSEDDGEAEGDGDGESERSSGAELLNQLSPGTRLVNKPEAGQIDVVEASGMSELQFDFA
ncbi:MAG: hypothetical protein AAF638_02175, partial [Pseudomonadota bacterium]